MDSIKTCNCWGILLLMATVVGVPTKASAWVWDDTCSKRDTHEAESIVKPQAMIMLDGSGSMSSDTCEMKNEHVCQNTGGWPCGNGKFKRDSARSDSDCRSGFLDACSGKYLGYIPWTEVNCQEKWQVAKNAINTLVQDKGEDINFGLGKFHTTHSGGWFGSHEPDVYIDLEWDEAQPHQVTAISDKLDSLPGGNTPMAEGIEVMRDSATVSNSLGGSSGILITDGQPTTGETEAVDAACRHRSVAKMYVVGFGTGTDEQFNDLLAVAGGRGTCSTGDPCDCSGSTCVAKSNWRNHLGYCSDNSFQADSQTELKQALGTIANEVSCTFNAENLTDQSSPYDWDDPIEGCADDHYRCLDIKAGPTQESINYVTDPNGNNGWTWASSEHRQIRFLNIGDAAGVDDNYCDKVRTGAYANDYGDDIVVTRACMCVKPTTNPCGGPDDLEDFCFRNEPDCSDIPGGCECPYGTWTCEQGLDVCEQDDPCGADMIEEGGECTVGQGECRRTGAYFCNSDGESVCSATEGQSEPEKCDGLDNDCDGVVDNNIGWEGDLCRTDTELDESGPGSNLMAGLTSRCQLGTATCNPGGEPHCEALDEMPEVCNGIDDDCDGTIDNLASSWENFDPEEYPRLNSSSIAETYEPAACYERNVCTCPTNQQGEIIRGGVSPSNDYTDHLSTWANSASPAEPTCQCGEGLVD